MEMGAEVNGQLVYVEDGEVSPQLGYDSGSGGNQDKENKDPKAEVRELGTTDAQRNS